MNREIKFRAWLINEKRMVFVQTIMQMPDESFLRIWPIKETPNKNYPTNKHAILMQFTGLHDRQGKEIYEGDIVQNDASKMVNSVWSIIFKNGAFRGKPNDTLYGNEFNFTELYSIKDIEIIGNIYENLELLRKNALE